MYALNEGKGRIKPLFTPDVAINCCHGGLEEGGGVSALCRYNDIPLASPDLASSAVFMDKCMTKVIMRGLDIPTVDYIRVNEEDYQKRGAFLLKRIANRLKYPVIVKPAHLGSSIGISLARNEAEVKQAIDGAFALDNRILIEKYLENKQDINCAAYALNGEIFVSEAETAFGAGVYSFEEKYIKRTADGVADKGQNSTKDGGRYALSGELREKIRSYTKTIYKRMNLAGAVRMDYLVSDGKAYLCEVNTVPGSLAYYLFCERMTDARTFFGDLMEEALQKWQVGEKKILTTGILNGVVGRHK
jgi:D-alanine-D-alanine ligase